MIPPSILFRQATSDDAPTIAAVKSAVWPDESSDVEVISKALRMATHHTHLAVADGQVAGFVSCFMTQSISGEKRWEVDLLAVHPRYRRCGLARKLVGVAITIGEEQAYDSARALIQIENRGSQRTFAQNGFETDGPNQTLFICTKAVETDDATITLSSGSHLVMVNTLGYSGIWLEGAPSAEALTTARAKLGDGAAIVAGTIIPDADQVNQDVAQANQFEPVGQYQRWFRDL